MPIDLNMVSGLVQRSVETINSATAVVGASAADYGRSYTARHGSTEQGSMTRQRSRQARRDRTDAGQEPFGSASGRRADHRMQNLLDLESVVEDIHDRLDTLERQGRMHGQTIAHHEEAINIGWGKSKAIDDDITAYKTFITSTHQNIDAGMKRDFKTVTDRMEAYLSEIRPAHDTLIQRVHAMDLQMTEIVEYCRSTRLPMPIPPGIPPADVKENNDDQGTHQPTATCPIMAAANPNAPGFGPAAPVVYQMSTPVMTEAPVDPWAGYTAHQQFGGASQPAPQASTSPGPSIGSPIHPQGPPISATPQVVRNPPREMPQSFRGDEQVPVGSPFHGGADPFKTPMNPASRSNFADPGVSAWAGGRVSLFEISRKKNDLVTNFTQDAKDFKLWRDRVVDHLCRSTQRWRSIPNFVQLGTQPLTQAWLASSNVDGINAWDLATMLEAYLVDLFPKSMYNRRVQLAGGEMGNGFEMWRLLYVDYQGGSDAVQFGGIRRLQEFPKCSSMAKLSEHLDDWMDVLTTYGEELAHCPRLLRNMVLGILPKNLEDEILEKSYKPEFRTYDGIIAWAKRKVINVRQKELSELSRKPPGSRINALKMDDDEDSKDKPAPDLSWASLKQEIVAVMREAAGQVVVPPVPQIHAVQRPDKKKTDPRKRSTSPGGAKKFFFKGCWHCGKEEPKHSRQQCPEFIKLLQRANPGVSDRKAMKLPVGYEGAYEKARKAAGLKNKERRVNMLDDEDIDDSDSDFEFDEPMPGRMCALRNSTDTPLPPAPHPEPRPDRQRPTYREVADIGYMDKTHDQRKSSFTDLAANDESLSLEAIDHLNGWATKVSRKSKQSKIESPVKPNKFEAFTIQNEKQLDILLASHPRLAAIPESDKKIRKVLKTMPAQLVCGPDEVLCLVDSGSTVNAAWIAKHFPGWTKHVKATPASMRGDTATTAGGHKLVNKGRCMIHSTAQDIPFPVAFKDMETELPILSVRKMVKRNNDVRFRRGGGSIHNRATGKSINFHEHEGVYFLKLKISDPKDFDIFTNDDAGQSTQSFTRQGR